MTKNVENHLCRKLVDRSFDRFGPEVLNVAVEVFCRCACHVVGNFKNVSMISLISVVISVIDFSQPHLWAKIKRCLSQVYYTCNWAVTLIRRTFRNHIARSCACRTSASARISVSCFCVMAETSMPFVQEWTFASLVIGMKSGGEEGVVIKKDLKTPSTLKLIVKNPRGVYSWISVIFSFRHNWTSKHTSFSIIRYALFTQQRNFH